MARAQTTAVTGAVVLQALYLLACRSLTRPNRELGHWSNPSVYAGIAVVLVLQALFVFAPFMHAVFGSAAIGARELAWAGAAAARHPAGDVGRGALARGARASRRALSARGQVLRRRTRKDYGCAAPRRLAALLASATEERRDDRKGERAGRQGGRRRTFRDAAARPPPTPRRWSGSVRRSMTEPSQDVTPLPDLLHGRSARRAGAGAPPGLRRPAAAVQRRLPGGREHPGVARAHHGGASRAGLARSWSPTIRSRRSTGASATTRARASATARTSTARSRSTRSSGSSATSRASAAGRSSRRRPAPASGCSSSAPGRAGCRPPTTWPGSATRSRSATRAPSPAG